MVVTPDEIFATSETKNVVPTETVLEERISPTTSRVVEGIVVPRPILLFVGLTKNALVFMPTLPFMVRL